METGIGIGIVWIALCIIAGVGARNKGRSFAGYFCLSLFLSPLVGLLAMAVAKPVEKKPAEEPQGPPQPESAISSAPQLATCVQCGAQKPAGDRCPSCGAW